jgi:hypothetical protein
MEPLRASALPGLRIRRGLGMLLLAAWTGLPGWSQETDSKPTPIVNAVEPPAGSKGERMNLWHDRIYDFLQKQITRVDHWFVHKGETPLPVTPFEMRIGMFGQFERDTDNRNLGTFPIEFDSRIELTNANRYLKLVITSIDPSAIPVEDRHNESRNLRLGVERTWKDDLHSTVGLKFGVHPQLYTHLDWNREIPLGHYRLYPYERIYWETGNGIGSITSLMADRWQNRWNLRMAGSLKWSKKKLDTDTQLGNRENGWEWETSFGLGYVLELLRVKDIGRAIAGDDMGRGVSARVYFKAAPGHATSTRIELFTKGEIWEKWIYYIIAPEFEWNRDTNWRRDFKIKIGVEMLFWKGR